MIDSKMKKTINRKLIMFYVWTGLAFLCMWMLSVLLKYPDEFIMRSTNYLWNVVYLVVFNFILWEYTLSSIRLNWKRILLGLLFIWLHIMFFSYGLYGWRAIGIALHIYTPLKEFKSVEAAVAYHMGLSMASVLFIGIVR